MIEELPPAITLTGIRKVYPLHQRPIDRLRETLGLGRPAHVIEHVALHNVDLTIGRGETVGLLGVNGAGKSTLLQIITGTLQPSAGEVRTHGRISALLELGAGFNPAWSGRKNAEFHCVMQGVAKHDMQSVMAAIEAFADIGPYFEEPAQTYSSGMYMRVAFGASVAVDPDILIVDEALAVGDVRFQNKCFRRFEEMQSNGTTILFVTHAPDLVTRFCSRGVLLDQGVITFDGSPADATRTYYTLTTGSAGRKTEEHLNVEGVSADNNGADHNEKREPAGYDFSSLEQQPYYNQQEMRSGSGAAVIEDALVLVDGTKQMLEPISPGSRLDVIVRISCRAMIEKPEFGLILRASTNQLLLGLSSLDSEHTFSAMEPGQTYDVHWHFAANTLGGSYFVDLGVADHATGERLSCDLRQSCLEIEVSYEADGFGLVYGDVSVRPSDVTPVKHVEPMTALNMRQHASQ